MVVIAGAFRDPSTYHEEGRDPSGRRWLCTSVMGTPLSRAATLQPNASASGCDQHRFVDSTEARSARHKSVDEC